MYDFWLAVWHTMLELAPWLLLGATVAGGLHILLPEDFVQRWLSGRGSVLRAVTLGVPLPLCSCGVIPMAVELDRKKASRGATLAFLISTPQTGVDSVLVSAGMLGWPFALFKVVAALVTGVIGGWWANRTAGAKASATGVAYNQGLSLPILSSKPEQGSRPSSRNRGLGEMLSHAIDLLRSIWGWLVLGVLVSAALSNWLPPTMFAELTAYGGLAAMGVALAVSLPLYVCATASVPIAAALVASGLPAGAALVFLMAGPATNVATMGAIYRVLGKGALAIYLVTIIVGSILSGMLFNRVLSTTVAEGAMHEHPLTWWRVACAVVLLSLIGWFAVEAARRWLQSDTPPAPRTGESLQTLPIAGMTCEGCVAKVESALKYDPQVRWVRVTLEPPQAVVVGQQSREQLQQLVEKTGYQVPTDF